MLELKLPPPPHQKFRVISNEWLHCMIFLVQKPTCFINYPHNPGQTSPTPPTYQLSIQRSILGNGEVLLSAGKLPRCNVKSEWVKQVIFFLSFVESTLLCPYFSCHFTLEHGHLASRRYLTSDLCGFRLLSTFRLHTVHLHWPPRWKMTLEITYSHENKVTENREGGGGTSSFV